MPLSARIIGQELGLTAQETNVYLQRKGFLDGEPGNYYPTEKGKKYVVEKDFHRGTGGYSRYNRYWAQRTFHESIMEELKDITPETKKEIRDEVALRRATLARERAEAQKLFEQQQLQKRIDEAKQIKEGEILQHKENVKKAITVFVILGIAAAVSYGVYRIVSDKRKKDQEQEDSARDRE